MITVWRNHKNKKASELSLFFACALALLFFPGIAMAAAPSFFTPLGSDKSIADFLNPLFGSLFGGTSGSAFEMAIGVFNGAALVLGGVIAAYTLIVGTMQTAHDGEMLGKQWSSMWVPIRMALGIGLVVPIANGFCVAQLLIAWGVTQGVYLADSVWTKYVTVYASPKGMTPTTILPNVDALTRSVLRSRLCVEAYNDLNIRSGKTATMTAVNGSAPVIDYGDCGTVEYTIADDLIAATTNTNGAMFSHAGLSAIHMAHTNAVQALDLAMIPIAKKIIQGQKDGNPYPNISMDLRQAQVSYQQSIAGVSSSVFGNENALSSLITSATQDGWYSAGAWYMKAAQMQDSVNRVIARVPTTSGIKTESFSQNYLDGMSEYFTLLDKELKASSSALSPSMGSNSGNGWAGGEGLSDDIDKIGNSDNPVQSTMNSFVTRLFGPTMQNIFQLNSNRDLIMATKDTGDYLMVGSEIGVLMGIKLIGAGGAVEGANESIPGKVAGSLTLGTGNAAAGGISKMLPAIGYLVISISMAMFAFAASISVYMPMLPFLIFFGTFLGWLLLVAEAIIAAPIWAIMHLNPNGSEMMGGARQGYSFILSLILRPVLIVLGFILALIAAQPILAGFNTIFFPVFKMSMVGSMVGLFTSIIMIIIYFGSIVFFMHKLFALTHAVPDKLLAWFGGGGGELGSASREFDSKGGSFVGGVVSTTRGAADTGARLTSDKKGRDEASAARKAAEFQEKNANASNSLSGGQRSLPAMRAEANSAYSSAKEGGMAEKTQAAVSGMGLISNLNEMADSADHLSKSAPAGSKEQAAYAAEATELRRTAGQEQTRLDNMTNSVVSQVSSDSSKADVSGKPQDHAAAASSAKGARDYFNAIGNTSEASRMNSVAVHHERNAGGSAATGAAAGTNPPGSGTSNPSGGSGLSA